MLCALTTGACKKGSCLIVWREEYPNAHECMYMCLRIMQLITDPNITLLTWQAAVLNGRH